jgi:transposase InsO family protein
MNGWQLVFWFLRAWFLERAELAAENLAYRQQLATYKYQRKRPRLRAFDRVFWVWLSRLWSDWCSALVIVQPATVVGWHRQGFRLYWRWKSRGRKQGRPRVDRQVQALIRRISRENSLWGAPRIQSELRLLGYDLAESTVALYIDRRRKPPSPTWRSFLANHLPNLAAVDFFVVPTATFQRLYCFVVLRLNRRRVLHFNVTANPSALWTAQQVVEAFPFDFAPRFLQRDRDGTYGDEFQRRIKNLGIEEVVSAPRSPWQNPYAERLIGSIRRELLHHVVVLNEKHLKRLLADYFNYYHESRTHLSLDRNAPMPREVEPPDRGHVIAIPQVGGLHHRYSRRAA